MNEIPIEDESCFGNFNGQLEKCINCEVAVECYDRSRKEYQQ